jgi:hypothetical protein
MEDQSKTPEYRRRYNTYVFLFGIIVILLFGFVAYKGTYYEGGREDTGSPWALLITGIILLLYLTYHAILASEKTSLRAKALIRIVPITLLLIAATLALATLESLCFARKLCTAGSHIYLIFFIIITGIGSVQAVRKILWSVEVKNEHLHLRQGGQHSMIPLADIKSVLLIDNAYIAALTVKDNPEREAALLQEISTIGLKLPWTMAHYRLEWIGEQLKAKGFTSQEHDHYVRYRAPGATRKDVHKPLRTNRNL